MKNEALIKSLASQNSSWDPMDSLSIFGLKYLCITALIFGLGCLILPIRDDFAVVLESPHFFFENLTWLTLSIVSALGLYESSFPQGENPLYKVVIGLLITVLIVLALGTDHNSFSEQFASEINFGTGGCGLLISAYALIQTPFLGLIAKKGAPKNAGASGLYAAMSSSALGCLLMQIVCRQTHSLHLLLWHFLPLTLTCIASSLLAKKLLRW